MFRLYYWIVCIFLLTAIQAFGFIDRLVYGEWLGKSGDKITQSLNLLLIVTSSALFVHGYRRRREIGVGGVLALATTAFLFLSAFWSFEPLTTEREAVLYLFVVVGAIGIDATLDADEFMDLLALACFLSAVASLILLAVSPGDAFGSGSTELRGVFAHKNLLGEVMATGALASLHGIRVGGRRRIPNILMLLVFACMAFASKSATSWLCIFVFCCVDGVITLYQKRGAAQLFGICLTFVLVPILLFVVFDPDPILEMIGKDPTLTGRTEIWGYVIDDIWIKPLLGWGYFAFWSVANPAAMEIGKAEQWFVPEAHNGLLEMLLGIGIVGTGVFILLLVRNLVLAFRCLRTSAKAIAISTLLSCVGILVVGVSETVLLAPTQSSTSVFFITGLFCERAARSKRRRYAASRPLTNRTRPRAQAAALTPDAARAFGP